MSPAAQDLRLIGFLALWRGVRPDMRELGADAVVVDELARCGLVEVADDGRLLGIHGLTTRSSRHRIEHPAGTIHTWCAFDAIGIPAALGLDATAVTTCPTCARELRVALSAGVPTDSPVRLWLPGGRCVHVIEEFCRHADLYCDRQHLDQVVRGAGRSVTVWEAAEVGRLVWRDAAAAMAATR